MKKKAKILPFKKQWWLAIIIFFFLVPILGKYYKGLTEDNFCYQDHIPTSPYPKDLVTAADWLALADYEYESGSCFYAIRDLNRAIEINPKYAEAYNNRAFINMRLKRYDRVLPDLNKAIELRPDYPHALMNRGDLYKHLGNKTEAIADYDKVIVMGKEVIKSEAVCGRRLMAIYDENWFHAMWDIITRTDPTGCVQLYFEK
ncbi:MAG: tetratricopeptide repeat protein [Candidatus Shapirobacteria bacterium]